MSRSYAFVQSQSMQVLDILDRIDQISRDADVTDEAGHWGLDGWIQLIHDLLDMQVRTLANITESAIQGPWWWDDDDDDDYDVDCFMVEKAAYARKIKIVERFTRLGTDEVIRKRDVRIDPEVLEPGQQRFRLEAVPVDRRGFNYRGTIELSEHCDSPRPSRTFTQTITIGL